MLFYAAAMSLCELWAQFTWNRRWGHWRDDGSFPFSYHAYPVLMSIAVEVVPPGDGSVGVAHHFDTVLTALVVIRLPGAPVSV